MKYSSRRLENLVGLNIQIGCKKFEEMYPRGEYSCRHPHIVYKAIVNKGVVFYIEDKKIKSFYLDETMKLD